MVYHIFAGEPKGLNAVEALEMIKTDAMSQAQIGFVKGNVQSAINESLKSFRLW